MAVGNYDIAFIDATMPHRRHRLARASSDRQTVGFGFERTRKMVRDDQSTADVDKPRGSQVCRLVMMHICLWLWTWLRKGDAARRCWIIGDLI
jgi:hypothetical protein